MIGRIIIGCMLLAYPLARGTSLDGDFSGQWDWQSAPESRTFSLTIKQQGKWILGRYCAVAKCGNKIDCDDEGVQNIRGTVDATGTSSVVEFASSFGATKGRAILEIRNGHLIWSILRNPIDGDFYAPRNAVQERSK